MDNHKELAAATGTVTFQCKLNVDHIVPKEPKKPKTSPHGAGTVNNITVHNSPGGVVNINLGKFPDDPNDPTSLDRRDEGFSIQPGDEDSLTEEDPPGPEDMGGSTVYGNMCMASNCFDIRWVGMPHVAFKEHEIVFNHAAIRKFGLRQNMAIMLCVTPDESAVRFFLGQERFPNNNSINKFGYYRLKIGCGGNKHKLKIHPQTGEVWANPDWMTGRLSQSNTNGSARRFPLMAEYPSLVGGIAPLLLDHRFYRTGPRGGKTYNVLYCRMENVRDVPTDMVEKTIGLFDDVVTARREWATTANDK